MMRKITQNAVTAFFKGENYSSSNTCVINNNETNETEFRLHGHLIASINHVTGDIYITDAGYTTNTTKDRLNGILSGHWMSIVQKKGVWYLITVTGENLTWNGSALVNTAGKVIKH